MRIVVFTRSTPDTAAKVEVDESGGVNWGGAPLIMNPWDDYAVEEALVQAKPANANTAVITVGSGIHDEALREGLKVGIGEAYRVWDDAVTEPVDNLTYAIIGAAAVQKLGDVELVIAGRESVDIGTDMHIIALARRLGWPMITGVSKILSLDFATKTLRAERQVDAGRQVISTRLPAVITVTKDINEPRKPVLMNIRKAQKAEIPVWSLSDLGVTLPAIMTRVEAYHNLPVREQTTEMLEGTPQEQAKKLVERLIEDKLL